MTVTRKVRTTAPLQLSMSSVPGSDTYLSRPVPTQRLTPNPSSSSGRERDQLSAEREPSNSPQSRAFTRLHAAGRLVSFLQQPPSRFEP